MNLRLIKASENYERQIKDNTLKTDVNEMYIIGHVDETVDVQRGDVGCLQENHW